MHLRLIAVGTALLGAVVSAGATSPQVRQMDVDADHVTAWNQFADKVYGLHAQQLAGREIRRTEDSGEYGGTAANGYSYKEISYRDAQTGKLLSRVRVDRERPTIRHIVEVFIHDEQGRVKRDFASIYLPWARNAPIRTHITLHDYPGGMHAERQFDASGERIFERCTGTHEGQKVYLTRDWEEIGLRSGRTPLYETCFAGMQERVGIYREPQ